MISIKIILVKIFKKLKKYYDKFTTISYEKIIIISKKRLKLYLYDYKQIAKPMKKFFSNEIWFYNEVYGFSYVLKKYAGYNDNYKLKLIASHGVRYRKFTGVGFSWEFAQNAPMIFTNSDFAVELIKDFVDKGVKIIPGSLQILYADKIIDNKIFKNEKQKLGKNLLIFPAHTDGISHSLYDFNNFINEIERIKLKYCFDSITICLFWRDIARGIDNYFLSPNFKITCAGHISDCFFLSRLRTIIELSDVVMGNSDTSAMWYSLALGKPFYYWNDNSLKYNNTVCHTDIQFDVGWYELHKKNEEIIEIQKLFSVFSEKITDEQKKLIDKYCDIKNFKSRNEIRDIFSESEQMYLSGNYKKYEKKVVYHK